MKLTFFQRGWFGRNIVILLAAAALISVLVTYLSITGSSEPLGIKPRRIWWMVAVNLGILLLLTGFIGARVYYLWNSLKVGSAGSKLQKRILILFTTVTIVPTIIVSIFSAVFFNLGIQTWFNERVQTAVNESLVVAEAYLHEHKENIRADALAMAGDLNRVISLTVTDPGEFDHVVDAQSQLRLLTEAIVFQRNKILAQGKLSFALAFERVSPESIEMADAGGVVLIGDEEDKVRALIKLTGVPETYLLVGRLIDGKVVSHMQNAQGAVNEYGNLKAQMDRLQVVFMVVFSTLAGLLLLSSIGYGMVFAARLTNPISMLVQAAERVRGGDFSARVGDTGSNDEIGTLARAFNRMTEQLDAQRGDLIEANRRLNERRRFSEAVLSGVSAGVIALDGNKKITLFNRSATTILAAIEQPVSVDTNIMELLPGINELLTQAEHLSGDVAQSSIVLTRDQKTITLHVRVTVEKMGDSIEGFIVTFDDITLLVSAQRNAAWSDVARRVAHEIKNPLTPIQLSAERLKRKYTKFITEDQEGFSKYVDTISKHVADIGRMVEEFVSFARMPTAIFANEDLVAIIKKAVFSAQVANPAIHYQLELPDRPVIISADERQITQIFTNLLKNAGEAIEARLSSPHRGEAGRGVNGTEGDSSRPHPNPPPNGEGIIKVVLRPDGEFIYVVIEDNGTGFPGKDVSQMLEPYVTTRTKGTGLGLSIVKKIMEDHKGQIKLENLPEGGARVSLSFLQHCDI